MQEDLLPLPNLHSKILRSNIKDVPNSVFLPFLKDDDGKIIPLFEYITKQKNVVLTPEETDILIILFHLFYTSKKADGLLYFNTDDILMFRSIKKNRALKNGFSGYKKSIRKRVDTKIKRLAKLKIFTIVDYKDFNFVLCLNLEYTDRIIFAGSLNQKILSLNPLTKSWHKAIGIFLSTIKTNLNSNTANIQIKKILSRVKTSPLFPYQIRNRFEDVLDELSHMHIIKGWQYKNIDEDLLNSKNWLFFWQLLSVKIFF